MHLLVDLDGTLSDPALGITRSIQHALAALGHEPPAGESLLRYIGPPLHESFAELLGCERVAAQAVAHYRERYAGLGLFENRVYDGIGTVLQALGERGHRLYVVTSKPTVYAERIVSHFALQSHFRKVYGSNLDGSLSRKDELVARVLSEEAIPAGRAVMIGDRRHDVLGAAANGVPSIGVLWGYGSREELETSGASCLCERPDLLTDCLVEYFSS